MLFIRYQPWNPEKYKVEFVCFISPSTHVGVYKCINCFMVKYFLLTFRENKLNVK